MTDAGFDLAAHVRDIPDFPKEGILFRDIMPLLQEPRALREAVDRLVEYGTGKHIDVVMGAEARGFILGAAVAYGLGAGFVCARKPGKLPHDTISAEYDLEYGTDKLEVHADAIKPGQNVLVHDDLLATGGTAGPRSSSSSSSAARSSASPSSSSSPASRAARSSRATTSSA